MTPPKFGEQGLSLFEVVVALLLSTVVMNVALEILLGCWLGMQRIAERGETMAMWDSLQRTLSHDIHSADAAGVSMGMLSLTMVDGTKYRYQVDNSGELVRVRIGGGTAVLSRDVAAIGVSVSGTLVEIQVRMEDGTRHTFVVCTAGGLTT